MLLLHWRGRDIRNREKENPSQLPRKKPSERSGAVFRYNRNSGVYALCLSGFPLCPCLSAVFTVTLTFCGYWLPSLFQYSPPHSFLYWWLTWSRCFCCFSMGLGVSHSDLLRGRMILSQSLPRETCLWCAEGLTQVPSPLDDCEGRKTPIWEVFASVDLLDPKRVLGYRCPGSRDTSATTGVLPLTEVSSQTVSMW